MVLISTHVSPSKTPPKLAWSGMNKQQRTWIVLSKIKPTRMVKVDNYEYESLADDILKDKISYKSLIEIFNDRIYWKWFQKNYIESDDSMKNTKEEIQIA